MGKEEFCSCKNNNGVYTENEEFGYWYHCSACNKKIENEFYYYDEPVLY